MALPTKQWQQAHHISMDPNCPWGCNVEETMYHILLSCRMARQSWDCLTELLGFVPPTLCSVQAWLDRMQRLTEFDRNSIEATYIAGLFYHLWRARNCRVHGEVTPTPSMIVEFATQANGILPLLGNWDSMCPMGTSNPTNSWSPPPLGWIKINFDGAIIDNGHASLGCIARDHNGQILHAVGRPHHSFAIDMVEFWASWLGLDACKHLLPCAQGVILEGDATSALTMVKDILHGQATNGTAKAIASLLPHCKQLLISHVRTANMAAHMVAHMSLSSCFEWVRGMPLPTELHDAAQLDWDVF